jgi:Brp/Blh family beta-carotene 15,15'-monooxygenase
MTLVDAPAVPGTNPAVLHTITRRILTPTTAIFGAVTIAALAVSVAGGQIPETVQLVPFAVSIVLFGLPHGALDHLVPARLRSHIDQRRSIAAVTVLYLIIGGATLALWTWIPVVGFVSFIVLTWFHWGQGDLYIDHFLGDGPVSRLDALLTVALRGALPMLLPLAADPGAYGTVIADAVRVLVPARTINLAALTDPVTRVTAGVVVLLLASAQLLLRWRAGQRIRRQLAETIVLAAFFIAVPPVLAVGLYFSLWHAIRHILRLELTDPKSLALLGRGQLLGPLLRFFRQAWPITLIAVVLLGALALILKTANLSVYLILIAALTTPHAVIVTWMDRRQQTWKPLPPYRRTPND